MKCIGLTGRMGAGKDEVAAICAEQGWHVIDVDAVAHEIYLRDESLSAQLVALFGKEIIYHKQISREKLGTIVFADPAKLEQLNALMFPLLSLEVTTRIKVMEAKGVISNILINAALLYEIGLHELCSEIWVADADTPIIMKRLQVRGMTRPQILARLSKQKPSIEYRKLATRIIENNEGLEELNAQVLYILQKLEK